MKKELDFIIIGAQKSGTTTLFELLKQHPNLYLPPEKELPFFGTKREPNGWDWYMDEYFHKEKIDEQKLWGTVTPVYMSGEHFAEKLFKVCPHAKLIAILRDPFERAYSHYQMSVKRGIETRSFPEAAHELMTQQSFENARQTPTESNAYFAWSEYGRILSSYAKYYDKENILVLSLNELEHVPKATLDKICRFLGIGLFTPDGLGKKFHQGGTKRKMPLLNKLVKNQALKSLSKKLFDGRAKRTIKRWMYWIDQWNTKKGSEQKGANEIGLKELKQHFLEDTKLLESEFDFKAPWLQSLKY